MLTSRVEHVFENRDAVVYAEEPVFDGNNKEVATVRTSWRMHARESVIRTEVIVEAKVPLFDIAFLTRSFVTDHTPGAKVFIPLGSQNASETLLVPSNRTTDLFRRNRSAGGTPEMVGFALLSDMPTYWTTVLVSTLPRVSQFKLQRIFHKTSRDLLVHSITCEFSWGSLRPFETFRVEEKRTLMGHVLRGGLTRAARDGWTALADQEWEFEARLGLALHAVNNFVSARRHWAKTQRLESSSRSSPRDTGAVAANISISVPKSWKENARGPKKAMGSPFGKYSLLQRGYTLEEEALEVTGPAISLSEIAHEGQARGERGRSRSRSRSLTQTGPQRLLKGEAKLDKGSQRSSITPSRTDQRGTVSKKTGSTANIRGKQNTPTQQPFWKKHTPTPLPIRNRDTSTQQAIRKPDNPTQHPIPKKGNPTQQPIRKQDTPTHQPIRKLDNPTQHPNQKQDTPTQQPILTQDDPTQQPIRKQGNPKLQQSTPKQPLAYQGRPEQMAHKEHHGQGNDPKAEGKSENQCNKDKDQVADKKAATQYDSAEETGGRISDAPMLFVAETIALMCANMSDSSFMSDPESYAHLAHVLSQSASVSGPDEEALRCACRTELARVSAQLLVRWHFRSSLESEPRSESESKPGSKPEAGWAPSSGEVGERRWFDPSLESLSSLRFVSVLLFTLARSCPTATGENAVEIATVVPMNILQDCIQSISLGSIGFLHRSVQSLHGLLLLQYPSGEHDPTRLLPRVKPHMQSELESASTATDRLENSGLMLARLPLHHLSLREIALKLLSGDADSSTMAWVLRAAVAGMRWATSNHLIPSNSKMRFSRGDEDDHFAETLSSGSSDPYFPLLDDIVDWAYEYLQRCLCDSPLGPVYALSAFETDHSLLDQQLTLLAIAEYREYQ
mmetsp:Transcript_20591/g.35384  ORF Transcript_20591/g.35384 Transcript_20591/m.35384 type:complete len:902 (+) Transcript_20591:356-3061(+)